MKKNLDQCIEILTHRIEEYERRIIEKSELSHLSPRQLYYLDEIYHKEETTITELAEKIDVSKPSATTLVHKLEKYGYIKKIRSEEDKRSFHIVLTEKGMALASLHDGIHHQFAQKMMEVLSISEVDELYRLLNKVVKNMA
jgi:DNA-binding MarR family transcriptional regulator